MNTIKDIIESHIHLNPPNNRGWRSTLCKVCNDHGKKGPRSGFVFSEHGAFFNCFNCGHKAGYEPATAINENGEHIISNDMLTVFESFGIAESEWNVLALDCRKNTYSTPTITTHNIEPAAIELLPFFYPLTDSDDEWCQYSIEYLTSRCIPWQSYPFYCVKLDKTHPLNKNWYGRLVIPIYKDNNLIFFQGRDLTNLHTKKYLNINIPRDNILYGYDHLSTGSKEPLYIVEGWFDAFLLNGIAVLGKNLTAPQIKWINKSDRTKVVIPDRTGDGYQLAEQAIKLGWNISTIDVDDTDCKDVNDSIIKYGELFTINTIINNTSSNTVQANALLGVFCKGDMQNGNGKRKRIVGIRHT